MDVACEVGRAIKGAWLVTKRKFNVAFLLFILSGYSSFSTLIIHSSVQAFPSSSFISVVYRAQETDYYCGPACVQMALSYLMDSFPSQSLLASEMHTNPWLGATYTNEMRVPFDKRELSLVFEETLDLDELKTYNSNGYPVIILIYSDTNHRYQHYVLVIGYDSNGIYVHDPWPTSWSQPECRLTGANVSISYSLLNDLWSCQISHWGLVIPYSGKVVKPVLWWQEYWYLLVGILAAAVSIIVLVLVRRKRSDAHARALEELKRLGDTWTAMEWTL